MADAPRPEADPLLAIDPFALLMDARHQLFTAIETLEASPHSADRIAVALGAVVAHDVALAELVRALIAGQPPIEEIVHPDARRAPAAQDEAQSARNALFEALSASGSSLDAEVDVPWAGRETWHVHLIGLAIYEGAQAHALREGDLLPASL